VSHTLTIAAFVLAGLALGGLELWSRRPESRVPSLGAMAAFVMGYRAGRVPIGRIAMYGFWWWIGWHFFAR
jgi:hypothetical protein